MVRLVEICFDNSLSKLAVTVTKFEQVNKKTRVRRKREGAMFSTLQRPTLEELERRRAMRETFSPPRSSTLQRRESVLSRGFNALFRDDL